MKSVHAPDPSKVAIVEVEFKREGPDGVRATFGGRAEFADAMRFVLSQVQPVAAAAKPPVVETAE